MSRSLDLYDSIKLFPDISDELAAEMHSHLICLVQRETNGKLFILDKDKVDIKNVAYNWEEKWAKKKFDKNISPAGCVDVVTFHKCGHPSLFKPSLYEIYCNIFGILGDKWRLVKYFYIVNSDMDVNLKYE